MNAPRLRLLIVDDEPLARMRLKQLIDDIVEPRAEVVGEAGDAAAALALLDTRECELVLLDVQMPGLDGLQFADRLRGRPRAPAVVFVTAHAEHAVQAFELEALDYLTKPVRRDRLEASLRRAAQRRAASPSVATGSAPAPGATGTGAMAAAGIGATFRPGAALADVPVLVVTDRGRVVRVPLHEILYLKAELKYVTLRTVQRSYVLDESLSDLEQRLGEPFLRVHRNALVARRAVRALERRVLPAEPGEEPGEGWVVRMDGAPDEWIVVSRRQVTAVREALRAAGL